jgi:hypothetical protein
MRIHRTAQYVGGRILPVNLPAPVIDHGLCQALAIGSAHEHRHNSYCMVITLFGSADNILTQ